MYNIIYTHTYTLDARTHNFHILFIVFVNFHGRGANRISTWLGLCILSTLIFLIVSHLIVFGMSMTVSISGWPLGRGGIVCICKFRRDIIFGLLQLCVCAINFWNDWSRSSRLPLTNFVLFLIDDASVQSDISRKTICFLCTLAEQMIDNASY